MESDLERFSDEMGPCDHSLQIYETDEALLDTVESLVAAGLRQNESRLVTRARAEGRPVRAFGEMVALLWARGQTAATLRLEHLWHGQCRQLGFPLFCASPRLGFVQDATFAREEICATHDRLLGGMQ
jgi:hypothetical protein